MLPDTFYSKAEEKVLSKLITLGYPEENLERPQVFSGEYTPDIVVLTPGIRRVPMAIIEVKFSVARLQKARITEIATKMQSIKIGCAAYLVDVIHDKLRIFDCTNKDRIKELAKLPTYEELENLWRRGLGYLVSLRLKNFTLFKQVKLEFGKHINVFIGENGFGKSTLLRLLFSETKYASDFSWGAKPGSIVKRPYIEEIFGVRSRELISHGQKNDAVVEIGYEGVGKSSSRLILGKEQVKYAAYPPLSNRITSAVFFQSHELLTNFQFYSSIANVYGDKISKDGTIKDTVQLLGLPMLKTSPQRYREIMKSLEKEIGCKIELDIKENKFYCKIRGWGKDRLDIDMTAEGWRKLGQLLILLQNGVVYSGTCLFWDEPEANLNPKLIKILVSTLIALSKSGVQLFLSTHSQFFANEIEIQLAQHKIVDGVRFFNLKSGGRIDAGKNLSEIIDVSILDESMGQADRYMALDL